LDSDDERTDGDDIGGEDLWAGIGPSLPELLPGWAISFQRASGGGYLGQAENNRGTLVVRAWGATVKEAREALTVIGAQEIVLPAELAAMGWHVSPCLDEDCAHGVVLARERPQDPARDDRDVVWAFCVSLTDDGDYRAFQAVRSHFANYDLVLVDVHSLSLSPAVVRDRNLLAIAIESERNAVPFVIDIDVERDAEAQYERQDAEARAEAVASGIPEDVVDELMARAEFAGRDAIEDWNRRKGLRSARLRQGVPEELVDEVVDHELLFGSGPYE
jgi:hypothetical protein